MQLEMFPIPKGDLAQYVPLANQSSNENCLYHFTTLDSFLKIWVTQKLLLSSRKQMNDSAEQENIASGIRNYSDFLAYWYAIDEYKQLDL